MVSFDNLYDKEYYGERLKVNRHYDKKLYFKIIENGTVLPYIPPIIDNSIFGGFGGIVDNKGKYFKSSFVSCKYGEGAYTPTDEVKFVDETVIYLGMFVGVWGHSITDNLKHVWFLQSDAYKNSFKDCRIVYNPWKIPTVGGGTWCGISPSLLNLFKILEIDADKWTPITEATKFKNIIFPDESFFSNDNDENFFTNEYLETIDRIRNFAQKNFTELSQKKFYFNHGRGHLGEERLAEYFKAKGYEVVRPETLPIEEQVNLLANCTDFASTVGSCALNMIFTRDNTNVILIPRYTAAEDYSYPLSQIHGMNVKYIDSAVSLFQKDSFGPFCYIISKQLKKFFGDEADEYSEDDLTTFLQYVKFSISQGFKENLKLKKYYSKILAEIYSQLAQRKDLAEKFGIVIN